MLLTALTIALCALIELVALALCALMNHAPPDPLGVDRARRRKQAEDEDRARWEAMTKDDRREADEFRAAHGLPPLKPPPPPCETWREALRRYWWDPDGPD